MYGCINLNLESRTYVTLWHLPDCLSLFLDVMSIGGTYGSGVKAFVSWCVIVLYSNRDMVNFVKCAEYILNYYTTALFMHTMHLFCA